MSLLDDASLLLTPNAYKEGKLYSVIPSNGNGDFTATRATTATRVNSLGLVDLVPYNLLSWSEMFSNAAWTKTNSTISANVTTAPNGTMTADKLVADATLAQHATYVIGPSGDASAYTFSCYAKAAEYSFFSMGNAGGVSGGSIIFNLTNGTISGTASGVTPSIESVGNGWYRCAITLITTPSFSWWILARNANNTSNYTGNGTDGLFIWGAQLVQGTSARDYLRTETRLNIPRIDYSLGGCPNILLEPQRTNLALQSSSFDSATWTKTNVSVTANTTTSPSGVVDADTLAGDGTTNQHQINQSGTVTSGLTYTTSIYAKKNTNNFIQIYNINSFFGSNVWANFDLNNGVVGSVGSSTTASIQSVGNGWYRCSITGAAISSGTSSISFFHLINSATSVRGEANTLNTSVFLWGAQFEAGAYATSFIPTTTASVTRNADSITRNNIFTNGLITSAGGTWFVELRNNVQLIADNATLGLWLGTSSSINTSNGTLYFRQGGGNRRTEVWKYTGGVGASIYQTTTNTCKIAIKWNGSTADVFENGVKVVSATAFAHNNMEFLNNNTGRNTFINEMALFPTPLTDAQCIALTQ